MRARITIKKHGCVCVSIWIVSSLLNINYFMKMEIKEDQGVRRCLFSGTVEAFLIQYAINYLIDSFLPFAIMLLLYYKMKKRFIAEENETSFSLSDQSRQRNRRALRTIRGLIMLFTVTVIPVRILDMLFWGLFTYGILAQYAFVFVRFMRLFCYLNNILNIFIYAKMIPGFRRFFLTVFTFGMYRRRNVIN